MRYAGLDTVPSEDNLVDPKAQSSSHLDVTAVSATRTWSSDDLRSMGAPLSGPSGLIHLIHLFADHLGALL